ncbi:unnamed protein product [Larinioides sclopetarius]|uniref:Uncharacterized protein n=1 Tax=Larinioides sclopetarius TaxID=280406 RepID=A0AAV1YTL2_9ARAC
MVRAEQTTRKTFNTNSFNVLQVHVPCKPWTGSGLKTRSSGQDLTLGHRTELVKTTSGIKDPNLNKGSWIINRIFGVKPSVIDIGVHSVSKILIDYIHNLQSVKVHNATVRILSFNRMSYAYAWLNIFLSNSQPTCRLVHDTVHLDPGCAKSFKCSLQLSTETFDTTSSNNYSTNWECFDTLSETLLNQHSEVFTKRYCLQSSEHQSSPNSPLLPLNCVFAVNSFSYV